MFRIFQLPEVTYHTSIDVTFVHNGYNNSSCNDNRPRQAAIIYRWERKRVPSHSFLPVSTVIAYMVCFCNLKLCDSEIITVIMFSVHIYNCLHACIHSCWGKHGCYVRLNDYGMKNRIFFLCFSFVLSVYGLM